MTPPPQEWDPDRYAAHAPHIPARGRSLVAVLDPQPGERILDLGCGPGTLSTEIVALGASVVGVDASVEMVAAARARGIDARLGAGEHLPFDREFDAVFSNAAMHWMNEDPDAVLSGVYRALKPGGRFISEFGGFGNVAAPRLALRSIVRARGIDPDAVDPWFFPSVEGYRPRLSRAGFEIDLLELFAVPTGLASGMDGWLRTFAVAFLGALPESQRAAGHAEALEMLTPVLRDELGNWSVDHMRLRLVARRPS